jgi:hypothetical protein
MSKWEVDWSFEDFNLVMIVEAEDEYQAEVVSQDKLMSVGIDTRNFMLYETTIDPIVEEN